MPPFLEHPTGVTPGRCPIGRGRLATLTADPGGRLRGTILLVPGLTGSKEDFLALLPLLAGAGWRAVAIDLYGQYQSDGSDDPEDYRIPLLAADLAAAAEALTADVLVAHSFGGLLAIDAVLSGTPVRRLVLLSSGATAIPAGRRRVLTEALAQQALQVTAEQAWEAVVAMRTAEGTWPPPDPAVARFLRERWLATRRAHMAGCAAALLAAADRTAELRAAGLPVSVLHGAAEDAWPPPRQQELAAALGVAAVAIAGAAHSPAAEAPAETAEALLAALTQA